MKGKFSEALRAIALAACVAGLGVATVGAQQPPAADNSKVNTRDRVKGATTADQQSNAKPDVDITKEIRQAIVADKELSTYAHNVKIVTRRGKVTLKGPVTTVEEKNTVEAKATAVAGAANVTNQISIAPKSDSEWTSRAKQILEDTGAEDVSSTGESKGDMQNTEKPMLRGGAH